MTDQSENYHSALASGSRRQLLDALAASSVPLDAQSLAARLGLHVTTVRFHLDQLEAASLVRRQSGARQRRGRPSVLYATAGPPRDDAARTALIAVLAETLGSDGNGPAVAAEAGRRWAASLATETTGRGRVAELLERLGFAPVVDGDSIRLHSCPFRENAREHPDIVCSVHRGFLEQTVRDDTEGLSVTLAPFVGPELCLVTLARNTDTARGASGGTGNGAN